MHNLTSAQGKFKLEVMLKIGSRVKGQGSRKSHPELVSGSSGFWTLAISHSQSGIAQILVLLLLVAGIGLGTYLVQQRTHILPFADCGNDCYEGDRESEPEHAQDEQQAQQKEEEQNLERGAAEAGKSVEEYKDDDCNANPGKASCVQRAADKQKAAATSGDSGNGGGNPVGSSDNKTCSNTTRSVTGTNVRSEDGSCWDGLENDTQNLFNAKYCNQNPDGTYQRCQKAKDGWMAEADANCRANGTCSGSASKPLSEADRLAIQKDAADKNKATLDAIRKELDPEFGKFGTDPNNEANMGSCVAQVDQVGDNHDYAVNRCTNILTILQEISTAQASYDYAKTSGLTGASATAAFDQAKLLSRSASCDAVAAGIPSSNCVLDLGDKENIITAKLSSGTDVRVFIGCSTDPKQNNDEGSCRKVLNYRDCTGKAPDCKDGPIKELPENAAKALGIIDPGNIYDMALLPQNLRKSAQDLCLAEKIGCIAGAQASGQTPADNTPIGQTPPGIDPNWVKKNLSECQSNCTGFPNDAICLQNKSTHAYNCTNPKSPPQALAPAPPAAPVHATSLFEVVSPLVPQSPQESDDSKTEGGQTYTSHSTTTNFNNPNNQTTVITVTVTKATSSNHNGGQTTIAYSGQTYDYPDRIDDVKDKGQLTQLLVAYANAHKEKPIPYK